MATSPADSQAAQHLISPIIPIQPFVKPAFVPGGLLPVSLTALSNARGFIVVATNHPPDSLISAFPDGHELKFTPYWPAEADRRTQGVAIGKFADVDEDEPGRAARSRGISALSYRVKEIVGSV